MANEYREKYLQLKNEYTYLKNQQTGMINDIKREVETQWTSEIRRTDEMYRNEVNQYERIYKDQERQIDNLKDENRYLLKQIEQQAAQEEELKIRFNQLQDDHSKLTLELKTMKTEHEMENNDIK